jgi:hypothetical protein
VGLYNILVSLCSFIFSRRKEGTDIGATVYEKLIYSIAVSLGTALQIQIEGRKTEIRNERKGLPYIS